MSGPLVIETVRIAGFRGVTASLDLDLTAPITMVYAPNGTGKTTFCEAIEWLLTGQVERLREGAWDNDVLRSAFLEGVPPEVEAKISVDGQPHLLWRTPDGAWIDNQTGNPRRPGDVLQLLAPAAAAPNRHHNNAIKLRQHYLRGTRFLTSEALAALVDNSPESLTRRQDVFADLLGIRHLRDAEQGCARFVAEMAPKIRELEAESRRLLDEAAELRRDISNVQASAASASENLAAAEELLGLRPPGVDVAARLQAVAAATARARHDGDRRREALDRLATVWSRMPELATQIGALRKAEADANAALQQRQSGRLQADSIVSDRIAAEQAAADAVSRLSSAEDSLRIRLAAVLRAAALAEPYLTSDDLTLGALLTAAPEARWDPAAREEFRGRVRAATAAERRVDQVLADQADLAGRRSQLEASLPSAEDVQSLRAAADESDKAAADAQRDAEALAGPIATLQSAGRSVIDHQHDEASDCPLCGHDWRERSRLVEAVERTLNAAPELVATARSVASRATEQASAARKAHGDAVLLRQQAESLDREAQALEQKLNQDRRLFEAVDAPLVGDERGRVLEWAERRLDLAEALADLSAEQLATLSIVTTDGARYLTASLAINQLQGTLDRALSARRQALEAAAANARGDADTSRAQLAEQVAAERTGQEALAAVRRDLAVAEREQADILALWTAAAGEENWSPVGLERLRSSLAEEVATLDLVESRLAAARGAWDSETKHARLARIEHDLAPIHAKASRLKMASDTAERTRGAFRDSYVATSQKQVGGLSRVVNALFLRMHANRIVDRIELGEAETFLHWLADAGATHLDPGRDFSQGQRQDLALALFLARARGLGGTFFLDEPVAHLDDLNRVGLMDVFRAVALEGRGTTRLVITTASRSLARHLIEKFGAVNSLEDGRPVMRAIELTGNGRLGVTMAQVYPMVA